MDPVAATPEPPAKNAATPEPPANMAATPEPPAIIDVTPKSSAVTDATSVFPVTLNVVLEDTQVFQGHLRLISRLTDPPLISAKAVDFPRPAPSSLSPAALSVSEAVSISSVLPVMTVAILCVWATY